MFFIADSFEWDKIQNNTIGRETYAQFLYIAIDKQKTAGLFQKK
jgi:hypothetical protein